MTGGEIYLSQATRARSSSSQGPIFGNLVLADEINRAPAKVQSALLEAMEERQVTVAGKRYKLPDLFMVLATQNPIEQEGTYPLPEAQMDRFLMHVRIDYPSDGDEVKVLRLVRGEQAQGTKAAPPPRSPQKSIFDARGRDRSGDERRRHRGLHRGAGRRDPPAGRLRRQAQGLDRDRRQPARLARPRPAQPVHAWLHGRDHVLPEDVQAIVHDCLRHRVSLSYEASAEGVSKDQVIDEIVKQVAVAA